jgi:Methyltransferase domain
MTLKHFMAAQMRKPSGWFGSVILRRLLNRMKMAVVESTLSRIGLEPHHHHHLLEICFGGGAALALVSKRLITGIVTGVDFSPEMVREAERRFGLEIANGHLRVQLGDIAALPFASATFDRVFTIIHHQYNLLLARYGTGLRGNPARAQARRSGRHRPALAREYGARLVHSAWVPSLLSSGGSAIHAAGRLHKRETHAREARDEDRRSARLWSCLRVGT